MVALTIYQLDCCWILTDVLESLSFFGSLPRQYEKLLGEARAEAAAATTEAKRLQEVPALGGTIRRVPWLSTSTPCLF